MQGNPEAGDFLGSALAKGDFNADGFTDLAVGAPFEDLAASSDAGAVVVFYGDQNGLPNSGGQVLTQANPEQSDAFGEALDGGFSTPTASPTLPLAPRWRRWPATAAPGP